MDDRHKEFADWITRFYASHKYIPDGHSDGELIGKLIRCKDCKYRNEYSYCTLYINWHHLTGDMDYCSDAERKEDDQTD